MEQTKRLKNFITFLIITSVLASFSLGFYPPAALASTTDGTIDTTNRYAWSENAGWIDFGSTQGNVHVTDVALSGYAWGENIGWVSLNCSNTSSCGTNSYSVANDSNGTLSGYAWSENAGWISFAPTGGGVTINSSGVFSGYAWGENIGWVNFSVTNPVTTDWRPASSRTSPTPTPTPTPAWGGGLPPVAYQAPISPANGFSVAINNNSLVTNSPTVSLQLNAGNDIKNMAISNTADLSNASQEAYLPTKSWNLCWTSEGLATPADCSSGIKIVYVKFYTAYGQSSSVVSASINYNPNASQQQPLPAGTPPQNPLPSNSFPSDSLVNDKGTIYLIEGNSKIGFTSMKVFTGLGYLTKYVVKGDTSNYSLSGVLSSSKQQHPTGSWVLNKKAVYYVTGQGLVPVPSWAVFLSNGGAAVYLVKANIADLKLALLPVMQASDSRVGK